MAKIVINKNYFKSLNKGIHNIKVHFKDGHASGSFEVKDKIAFTIEERTYTATAGMTFSDWVLSYNIGASGNKIVGFSDNGTSAGVLVYMDPALYDEIYSMMYGDYRIGDAELQLFEGDTPLQASTVLTDGACYGLDPNYPR